MSKLSGERARGRKVSEETRRKLSKSKLGEDNHFYGKKHTQETKDKISKLRLGKKLSKEHCESISKGITGANNPIARAVESYNPVTGEAIMKFNCMEEAKKYIKNATGKSGSHISCCVLGKRKRACKMHWRYSK